jgi:hypothetical protein
LARLHPLSAITVPQHLYNPTDGLPQMLADFLYLFGIFFLRAYLPWMAISAPDRSFQAQAGSAYTSSGFPRSRVGIVCLS